MYVTKCTRGRRGNLESEVVAAIRIRFGFITYARHRQWATDGRVATGQSTRTCNPYPALDYHKHTHTQVMSATPTCPAPG